MDQIERIMNHSGRLSCVATFFKFYPRIDFREQEGDSPFYTRTWRKVQNVYIRGHRFVYSKFNVSPAFTNYADMGIRKASCGSLWFDELGREPRQ